MLFLEKAFKSFQSFTGSPWEETNTSCSHTKANTLKTLPIHHQLRTLPNFLRGYTFGPQTTQQRLLSWMQRKWWTTPPPRYRWPTQLEQATQFLLKIGRLSAAPLCLLGLRCYGVTACHEVWRGGRKRRMLGKLKVSSVSPPEAASRSPSCKEEEEGAAFQTKLGLSVRKTPWSDSWGRTLQPQTSDDTVFQLPSTRVNKTKGLFPKSNFHPAIARHFPLLTNFYMMFSPTA